MPPVRLSRPARGAWVEILQDGAYIHDEPSRPARGAWVEILEDGSRREHHPVAPRKGRVG